MQLLLWLQRAVRAARVRPPALAALWLCVCVPADAHAHIRLDHATPAPGAVIAVAPARLRLEFSAHIEGRYTSITLVAPDSTRSTLGDLMFEPGSDRTVSVAAPHLHMSGRYTVLWRTAGADGHVIEGSYTFTLTLDSAVAEPAVDTASPPPQTHQEHAEPAASATSPIAAFARWLHFTALTLLLGTLVLRAVVLPRLDVAAATHAELLRRLWRALALMTLLLVVAALVRLWVQSVALHGSERALSTPLLSMMLTDTSWGRAWLGQAVLFALLAAAIVLARPARDRIALSAALVAGLGLAAIPALTGHAAGVAGAGLVVLNDTVHVAAAGAWIGTLALLMAAALPALRGDSTRAGAAADAVDRFSPVALTAAALVVLTGVINALLHFGELTELWTTAYGRVLVAKVALVACVMLAGAYNWRVQRPRLRVSNDVSRLRRSAAAELAFATLVLAATAILTGLPRP